MFVVIDLKGQYSITGNFTIFEQNEATIALLIYKIILKHQENEINQVLKEEQVRDWAIISRGGGGGLRNGREEWRNVK